MSSSLVFSYSVSLLNQRPQRKESPNGKGLLIGLLFLIALMLWVDSNETSVETALATPISLTVSEPKTKKVPALITSQMIETLGSVCGRELKALESDLRASAEESMLDPLLLVAIMQVESNCVAEAKSKRGAIGLMQVIPSTALSMGVTDISRPSQNIQAAAKYLRHLQSSVGENLDFILAAYHAGPTTIRAYRGIPPYKSTKEYVSRVRGLYSKLRGSPAAIG